MSLKPLTVEEIQNLLEGQVDVLTPLVKKEQTYMRHVFCPVCKSTKHHERLNTGRPFIDGSPLPNVVLVCECGAEYDPYTKLIHKVPSEKDPFTGE